MVLVNAIRYEDRSQFRHLIGNFCSYCSVAGLASYEIEKILSSSQLFAKIMTGQFPMLIKSPPAVLFNLLSGELQFKERIQRAKNERHAELRNYERNNYSPSALSWAGEILARYIIISGSSFKEALLVHSLDELEQAYIAGHLLPEKLVLEKMYPLVQTALASSAERC